ncbi:MAG: outer membrane lipoprotein carrier protein LolA [Bacteroidales bacterium]|nr:outer membrane lipoprotein carrier protein LolA [Bacteroidales bacterium]
MLIRSTSNAFRSYLSSFCIVCFLLLSPCATAQITHASQGRLDENATEALRKAASRFNQNVAFTVTATSFSSEKKLLSKQTAQVRYHKGKYRLSLPDQELISDGTTLWHWNKQASEVAISNVSTDDVDFLNPASLLTNYPQLFKPKYIRTDADGTAVIDLQPHSARNFHKLRLFIREEDGLLLRIEVHKFDSSRELYEISDFKRAATPASQFTFTPADHPSVEVIDMR